MKKKKRKTHLIYLNVEKLRSSASMKRSTKKRKKEKKKKEKKEETELSNGHWIDISTFQTETKKIKSCLLT